MALTLRSTHFPSQAPPAVTICIGPYHGLGFALVADADPADGLLDIAVFSRMSELKVVRHFLRVARGREGHEPRIEVLRGEAHHRARRLPGQPQ